MEAQAAYNAYFRIWARGDSIAARLFLAVFGLYLHRLFSRKDIRWRHPRFISILGIMLAAIALLANTSRLRTEYMEDCFRSRKEMYLVYTGPAEPVQAVVSDDSKDSKMQYALPVYYHKVDGWGNGRGIIEAGAKRTVFLTEGAYDQLFIGTTQKVALSPDAVLGIADKSRAKGVCMCLSGFAVGLYVYAMAVQSRRQAKAS